MIHYPHLLAFKTAQPVADAIADLARRDCLTIPEVCRRLILAGLRENGMDPAQTRHDHADQVAG